VRRFLALALPVVLLLSGCGGGGELAEDKKLHVVATAYPLFEAVAAVGGDRVHAVNASPLDAFGALTPAMVEKLRAADVVVTLGQGAQPEVDAALGGRASGVVRVLDDLPTRAAVPGEDVRGALDPFVWLDPLAMSAIVDRVRNVLADVEPLQAAKFQKRAKGYQKMLAGIDLNYSRGLRSCERKEFVSRDPRFQYLADRYGLTQVAVGTDAELAGAIARYRPTTVFLRDLPSVADARAIEGSLGVRVSTLDTAVDQTDQARRAGSGYGTVMDLDLQALQAALGCRMP